MTHDVSHIHSSAVPSTFLSYLLFPCSLTMPLIHLYWFTLGLILLWFPNPLLIITLSLSHHIPTSPLFTVTETLISYFCLYFLTLQQMTPFTLMWPILQPCLLTLGLILFLIHSLSAPSLPIFSQMLPPYYLHFLKLYPILLPNPSSSYPHIHTWCLLTSFLILCSLPP